MARMPDQHWAKTSSLTPQDRAKAVREGLSRLFPWVPTSDKKPGNAGPDQRGFMIGSVRL